MHAQKYPFGYTARRTWSPSAPPPHPPPMSVFHLKRMLPLQHVSVSQRCFDGPIRHLFVHSHISTCWCDEKYTNPCTLPNLAFGSVLFHSLRLKTITSYLVVTYLQSIFFSWVSHNYDSAPYYLATGRRVCPCHHFLSVSQKILHNPILEFLITRGYMYIP
jgi:hypothetical protein